MESEASTAAKTDNSNKDPAWKYVHLVNPNNRNDVACNFCSKVTKGGIFRAKQHLVGGFRNATMCKKCPTHVREELQEYMQQKASAKTLDKLPDYEDVEILGDDEDEDDVGTILRGSKGNNVEVVTGLFQVVARLIPSKEEQDKIMAQLPFYQNAEGIFGMDMAIRNRKKVSPGNIILSISM
ncbi:hypothetical protein GH714_015284 [Hevea brasiliensis]|uniref:BED-type domain-containing protein n=1 Tax=Hevea brasiliensis TaxID=3981 RepID=A0A6A6LGY2_HEVBR|nr:hypothetical protein GH714_015284 [Hevea brasiliensis]